LLAILGVGALVSLALLVLRVLLARRSPRPEVLL
jgi:hypothetical protein